MMKTTYNLNSNAGRAAAIANYLAAKPRTNYYEVVYKRYFYADGDYDDLDPSFFKEFTEEQVALVRELLALADEEGENIWAYLDDEEYAGKYEFLQQEVDGMGQWYLVPQYVDIEKVYHRYSFKYGHFPNGIEEKAEFVERKIELSDEEYSKLLDFKLQYPEAGFSTLRHYHPELFSHLERYFDRTFAPVDWIPLYAPTYIVEMTEADEDVKKILELNE